MRQDIGAAYNALDAKGQGTIDGMRAPGQVKKAFQKLEEFVPNETVLALASSHDPSPGMGQQRAMGAGASFGAIMDVAKSARLLVLTEHNLYEVQSSGMLNGHKPQGIKFPLADITDVRVRTDRSIGKMGAKERFLTIDYMRGMQLETREHVVTSDGQLETFANALTAQVGAVQELVAAAERAERTPAPAPVSVADELAKLNQLRESGVLDDAEFAQQKAKLLA